MDLSRVVMAKLAVCVSIHCSQGGAICDFEAMHPRNAPYRSLLSEVVGPDWAHCTSAAVAAKPSPCKAQRRLAAEMSTSRC